MAGDYRNLLTGQRMTRAGLGRSVGELDLAETAGLG